MIVYKDRAFCVAKCSRIYCKVKLTESVKKQASLQCMPIDWFDGTKTCRDFKPVKNQKEV